jgi:transposase
VNNEIRYETKRIDHLGIVAGICKEIQLIEKIDKYLGPSERKVSCGQAVQAMVLNALGFSSRALYLTPNYLHNKPVDVLIGEGLVAEDFNDDSLGRSLDDLYEKGVTEVFAWIATPALQHYGIKVKFTHLDTSSFHLHGEYEVEETEAIEITHGYSRDHRPDLKQAVLSLITAQQSALPVWLEVLSGNSSDKKSFSGSVKAYCEQFAGGETPYFVMDSAGYSEENLKEFGKTHWLIRVPETLKEAKICIETIDRTEMVELKPGYWGKEIVSEYGGIVQRWLVVYSQAAYEREMHGLEKRLAKETERVQQAWRKLCRTEFSCEADARTAQAAFDKQWRYHQAVAKIEPVSRYSRAGRPGAQDQPEIVAYQLVGEIEIEPHKREQAESKLGKFIIATNQLDTQHVSSQDMLAHYTSQGVSVERGFRFLKDPIFFAHSLFLKKPERIMALMMIMGLALLIYALAEQQLRQRLLSANETIPNQKKKPTQTPTMRWVFQLFEGIDLLLVWQGEQLLSRQVTNLRPEHLTVIHLLGPDVEYCYLDPD